MRNLATSIASLILLVACGADEKPPPKTSDFKRSDYTAATSGGGDASAGVTFVDVTRAAGIDFVHVNGATGLKWLPETMGSGVGVLDYDSDGDPDLLFIQSRPWDEQADAPTMRLYRNDGNWKFTDVTEKAGLAIPCYGMGVAIADYDADDDPDLYITCLGRNLLLRNEGGRFELVAGGPDGGTWVETDKSTKRTITHHSWSTGAAWFDADGDGDVDLIVVNYVKWSPGTNVKAYIEDNELAYTRPQLYEGDTARLYLQQDDGSFVDSTSGSGLEGARSADGAGFVPGKSMALCLEDFDADGRVDVFVANDTVQNFLFLNRGSGKFEEVAVSAGVGYDDNGTARAAMGIDSFSFDNSGTLSVLIGNFSEEPVSFYTVARAGSGPFLFRDEANRARVGRPTLLPLTFGLIVRDVDLDGYEDLVLANGHIEPAVSKLKAELQHKQSPQLFRNQGGKRFRDVSVDAGAGFQGRFVGRGLASGDLDGDGDLDLVFTANNDRPRVLRNDLGAGKPAGILVRLRQPRGRNRDALGAIVRFKGQRRVIRTGGSYLSQSQLLAAFGGADAGGTVEVTWPDGTKQTDQLKTSGPKSHTIQRR